MDQKDTTISLRQFVGVDPATDAIYTGSEATEEELAGITSEILLDFQKIIEEKILRGASMFSGPIVSEDIAYDLVENCICSECQAIEVAYKVVDERGAEQGRIAERSHQIAAASLASEQS